MPALINMLITHIIIEWIRSLSPSLIKSNGESSEYIFNNFMQKVMIPEFPHPIKGKIQDLQVHDTKSGQNLCPHLPD